MTPFSGRETEAQRAGCLPWGPCESVGELAACTRGALAPHLGRPGLAAGCSPGDWVRGSVGQGDPLCHRILVAGRRLVGVRGARGLALPGGLSPHLWPRRQSCRAASTGRRSLRSRSLQGWGPEQHPQVPTGAPAGTGREWPGALVLALAGLCTGHLSPGVLAWRGQGTVQGPHWHTLPGQALGRGDGERRRQGSVTPGQGRDGRMETLVLTSF